MLAWTIEPTGKPRLARAIFDCGWREKTHSHCKPTSYSVCQFNSQEVVSRHSVKKLKYSHASYHTLKTGLVGRRKLQEHHRTQEWDQIPAAVASHSKISCSFFWEGGLMWRGVRWWFHAFGATIERKRALMTRHFETFFHGRLEMEVWRHPHLPDFLHMVT